MPALLALHTAPPGETAPPLVAELPTTEQLARISNSAVELRSSVPALVALNNDEKKAAPNMAAAMDPRCRQLLDYIVRNPQMVPHGVDLAYVQAGLAAFEGLRRAAAEVDVLSRYLHDTEHGVGAYLRAAALETYNLLKRTGQAHGQHELLRDISQAFAKGRRSAVAKGGNAAEAAAG